MISIQSHHNTLQEAFSHLGEDVMRSMTDEGLMVIIELNRYRASNDNHQNLIRRLRRHLLLEGEGGRKSVL